MADLNQAAGSSDNVNNNNSNSSQPRATIIPASESHQTDPTEKRSPVRSSKNGWDGKLRIGNTSQTEQNHNDEDDEEEDDDDDASTDNESQEAHSQHLDTTNSSHHAHPSHPLHQHHDGDNNDTSTSTPAVRTAILQTGPVVEGGPPIDADEDLLGEYESNSEEIDLVHCRVSSLSRLGLERFGSLRRLCLRQNAIEDMGDLPKSLSESMEELDLYDNLVGHIRGLDGFARLKVLDLSFNKIKHIKRVVQCKELTDLYFVQNKISKIENLEGLTKLRNLELGGNRLRSIDKLETLTGLEELWLGKNKITEIKVSFLSVGCYAERMF
jgi:protein phosphatase 1 regulatory subunit 7